MSKLTMPNPTNFRPTKPEDLIGPSQRVARILAGKVARLNPARDTLKVLLYGPPGVGKSATARITAELLAGFSKFDPNGRENAQWPCAVEEISGVNTDTEKVRSWMGHRGMYSLFGDWRVIIVEELDRVPNNAQVALLDYLDKLRSGTAFIGTSNLQMDLLEERFQTRLQTWKVTAPTTEEIVNFLTGRFEVPTSIAAQIAVGSGGNVRAALLDTESHLDLLAA